MRPLDRMTAQEVDAEIKIRVASLQRAGHLPCTEPIAVSVSQVERKAISKTPDRPRVDRQTPTQAPATKVFSPAAPRVRKAASSTAMRDKLEALFVTSTHRKAKAEREVPHDARGAFSEPAPARRVDSTNSLRIAKFPSRKKFFKGRK